MIQNSNNELIIKQHIFNLLICDLSHDVISVEHAIKVVDNNDIFDDSNPKNVSTLGSTIEFILHLLNGDCGKKEKFIYTYILIWILRSHYNYIDFKTFTEVCSLDGTLQTYKYED